MAWTRRSLRATATLTSHTKPAITYAGPANLTYTVSPSGKMLFQSGAHGLTAYDVATGQQLFRSISDLAVRMRAERAGDPRLDRVDRRHDGRDLAGREGVAQQEVAVLVPGARLLVGDAAPGAGPRRPGEGPVARVQGPVAPPGIALPSGLLAHRGLE